MKYATIDDLPRKFTLTQFGHPQVYTATVKNGTCCLNWKSDYDGKGMDETDRVLTHINSGQWPILEILEPAAQVLPDVFEFVNITGTYRMTRNSPTTHICTRGGVAPGDKAAIGDSSIWEDVKISSCLERGAWTVKKTPTPKEAFEAAREELSRANKAYHDALSKFGDAVDAYLE